MRRCQDALNKDKMRIFIHAHLDEPARTYLQGELSGFDVYWNDKHAPVPAPHDEWSASEICFGNVPADWISGTTKLRWLQLESVGFEYYQKVQADMERSGIIMTNLRGMFAWPAAETALAGLLALLRGIDEIARAQSSRNWIGLTVRPLTGLLHGRKVLILGMGSIGRQICHLLRAFECDVAGFARTAADAAFRDVEQVDRHLGEFGVVINCLPSTPETINFFNRERLARFSREAIFVNVGRGSVVDEDALVEALQKRQIAGAVLDVFQQEPLPVRHPLWDCPRTIILQHTGGGYADELIDKCRMFLTNLNLYRMGKPLQNQVDLRRGY